MRKLLLPILFVVVSTTIGFSQFNFGAGLQLVLGTPSAVGIQGKTLYEVDDSWRGAGAFTFYLDDFYNWSIDLDAQYKLLKVSDNFDLSPLAGIHLANAGFSVLGVGANGTDIGINLGAFIDFVPSDSYHIYVEPKITLGGVDGLTISGGILF